MSREFYTSLFKLERARCIALNALSSASPHLRACTRARIEDAALLSRVPSLRNDERKGRVFIRRDEMHSKFARGEKSRRSHSMTVSMVSPGGLWSRNGKMRCRVYQPRLGKIRLGARQLTPRCTLYTTDLRRTLKYELSARIG